MRLKSIITLLLTSAVCLSAHSYGPYVVHEQRPPSPWRQLKRATSAEVLPMRFALTQSNLHELDARLMDVAHPEFPNYGKHYTAQRIKEAFAPSAATVDSVLDWLYSSGHSGATVSPSGTWVDIAMTVGEAEDLLQATYFHYEHEDGTKQIGCDAYSLPSDIATHLDFVTPTIHLHTTPSNPQMRKRGPPLYPELPKRSPNASTLDDLSNCSVFLTPACIKALYNIDYVPSATNSNTFGIYELAPRSFRQSDINQFAAMNNLSGPSLTPEVIFLEGGFLNASESGLFNIESDLDLEVAMALTIPQKIQLLQTGGNIINMFDVLLEGLDASYCADGNDTCHSKNQTQETVKPPNVLSISYISEEWFFPEPYLRRQCAEFGKLGLMGVSVLIASGDKGVIGELTGECLVTNSTVPRGTPTANGTIFNPGWPATCPYVTAVGGTMLLNGSSVHAPEQVWNTGNFQNGGDIEVVPSTLESLGSSGGFSNVFKAPSWQKKAVDAYLRNVSADFGATAPFNTSGMRGFPDISASSSLYAIIVDGAIELTDGTSASTPVVASILTLINDARIAAGKSTVGFVNPVLYSSHFSDAFNDITLGNSPGCNTSFSGGGFPATKGWDAATGLGTPNFEKLLEKFLALP